MSILLTGGAGYIGSHTAVELIKEGKEVVIADNLSNSTEDTINKIAEITGKKPLFYKIDVCNKASLTKLFDENKIETVIHFAGYKAVGESTEKPLEYYRNNIDSALSVLEVMATHDCHQFVFSSSATVYGEKNPSPYVETMQIGGCTNPYGYTKYMIEQILLDAAKADNNLSVVLLRYFNPVGSHESGLIGENPKGIPNNLMPYIMRVAAGKLEKLHIFGNDYDTPDGTGVRDFIHVVDLALGHVKAVAFASKNKGAEIFNLGTGKGYSVLDMVKNFEKVNNVKVPYCIDPRRPGDLACVYADASKAFDMLGWRAERGIDDMCRDSWTYISKN